MQTFIELLQNPFFQAAVALWNLPWKGYALWRAARNKSKWWFVVILVVNTMAVLEILYIFIFSKKERRKKTEPRHGKHLAHHQ